MPQDKRAANVYKRVNIGKCMVVPTPKRVQSPSSINTYNQCPRKYYYQYILKLPTKASIHTLRGNIAHSALQDFFEFDTALTRLEWETVLQKHLLELLKKHWTKKEAELKELVPGPELHFYFQETQIMLMNWVQKFEKKLDSEQKRGHSFAEAFKRLTPKTEQEYQSFEKSVRGFLDTIEEVDGYVRIMDYKTSKSSRISPEYRLQLAIYALLYHDKHKKLPDEVGIYFLKDPTTLHEQTIRVDEDLIRDAASMVEQIHSLTQSESIKDYPKKPGPLCKWSSGQCDFYEKCYNKDGTLKKE